MALGPFDRGAAGENPFAVQHELQEMMQDLVGIVRVESEMESALGEIARLKARAVKAGISGNREYNGSWHTALDLDNLLTVSEVITRAAIERKESRGAHFRDDYPEKSEEAAKFNLVIRRAADGSMALTREPLPPMTAEMKQIIEEMK
jgi:succinate dehydrogenase / fumarate reductase flavoprotein subunit